jgi:hypothetical protein
VQAGAVDDEVGLDLARGVQTICRPTLERMPSAWAFVRIWCPAARINSAIFRITAA